MEPLTVYWLYSWATVGGIKLSFTTMKEIKEGSRVLVSVYRAGIHVRSYRATVKGFTASGLVKVDPDRQVGIKCVSPDNVKLISSPTT